MGKFQIIFLMIVIICIIFLMIVNDIRQQIFSLAFNDSLEERFVSEDWRTLFWTWTREMGIGPISIVVIVLQKAKLLFSGFLWLKFLNEECRDRKSISEDFLAPDLWLGSSLAGSFTAFWTSTSCFYLFAYYLGLFSLFIETPGITFTRFLCLLALLGM